MPRATEMVEGLSMYAKSPPLFLPPWVLAWLVWIKNKGFLIPFDIPVVCLCNFSHPNEIPGKDCPFAIDGERYYFTKQVPRDASGKRSKRKAGEQGAYWKSTSKDINIIDLNGKLIGYMRKYTLYEEDKDDKRSANWYMEEYRVHDPHELDDPYVLCKIYEKESACPGHTEGSIRSLTKRAIERKRRSQPDQTNSIFDNMRPSNSNPKNPLQTQFDNNFDEDPIMQQTLPSFQNFPPNLLPIPRPHDASVNQNLPESIPWNSNSSQTQFDNNHFDEYPIMQQTLPPSENFLFGSLPMPMPHDASGNHNRPESIPWNSNLSQTQFDNNNFDEDPSPTSESLHNPCSSFYSNESLHTIDASFSGPSIPHYSFENLNAPDGVESPPYLWNH